MPPVSGGRAYREPWVALIESIERAYYTSLSKSVELLEISLLEPIETVIRANQNQLNWTYRNLFVEREITVCVHGQKENTSLLRTVLLKIFVVEVLSWSLGTAICRTSILGVKAWRTRRCGYRSGWQFYYSRKPGIGNTWQSWWLGEYLLLKDRTVKVLGLLYASEKPNKRIACEFGRTEDPLGACCCLCRLFRCLELDMGCTWQTLRFHTRPANHLESD